ncbi:hypothetical protein [Phenylobacterium sp.]|jgi:hypothetical protein|uniref:hypothetical protein n=1 Tax=Phenylobacterium sp. TaxID=1871053 RepID=UPI002F42B113
MAAEKESFLKRVHAWVIWFRLVGHELEKAPGGLTTEELAKAALLAKGANPDDGAAVREQASSIAGLLQGLSHWRLVGAAFVERPQREPPPTPPPPPGSRIVPPPRITPPPAYVAMLRPRGARLLKVPLWRQQLSFAARLIGDFKVWRPLRMAIGVAGILASVLKIALLWQSKHVAIAAAFCAAFTFLAEWLRARAP